MLPPERRSRRHSPTPLESSYFLRHEPQRKAVTAFCYPSVRRDHHLSWRLPGAMMTAKDEEITALLHRWKDGSVEAENKLFQAVMPELRKLARYFMQRERRDH